jgi:thioesterase domain-containing protein
VVEVQRAFVSLKRTLPSAVWQPWRSVGAALLSLCRHAVARNGQPQRWHTYPAAEFRARRSFNDLSVVVGSCRAHFKVPRRISATGVRRRRGLADPLAATFAHAAARTQEALTWVQHASGEPPLFFFHADYDTGGDYSRLLCDRLGPKVPFVAIAPHGVGGEVVPRSIQDMAADRLPLLQATQPSGPVRLAGHCTGGAVALEMARLLRASGREIELVVVIDAPLSRLRFVARALEFIGARRISECFIQRVVCFWALRADKRRSRARAWLSSARRARKNREPINNPILRAHQKALAYYRPQPLQVPLLYYSAEFHGDEWRRVCTSTTIVNVPGGHVGCVTTHIGVLANHLRSQLGRPASAISGGPQQRHPAVLPARNQLTAALLMLFKSCSPSQALSSWQSGKSWIFGG